LLHSLSNCQQLSEIRTASPLDFSEFSFKFFFHSFSFLFNEEELTKTQEQYHLKNNNTFSEFVQLIAFKILFAISVIIFHTPFSTDLFAISFLFFNF